MRVWGTRLTTADYSSSNAAATRPSDRKSLLAAAPQMPYLTLKLHAQPGLCLHHNHQQQIPWTNPALPLGKPLPPLNSTSLGTKTEQRRSHPQWRHRHRKRIGHFRPNPCLEPPTLDRTRLPSALRSPVWRPSSVGRQQTQRAAHHPRRRLHGKPPPALGAKANPQRKPCPPVGPSHNRHRPLRQNTAGGL